jgi:hypothetical protein
VNFQKEASDTKQRNVLDMALTFTAMVRLFEKDSKQKILDRLSEFCALLPSITSSMLFEDRHHEFCIWFVRNIKTAEKHVQGEIQKKSASASYGHAAKVLDVVLKVNVFYAHLPTREVSEQVIPFLHAAIDNQLLAHLKKQFQNMGVTANSIEEIDESQYRLMQRAIGRELVSTFQSNILPVEYDDIKWSELNRGA